MKLAFFHDTIIKIYDGKHYTSGGINDKFLLNYKKFFDEITLVTRYKNITKNEVNKLNQITLENISFESIKSISAKQIISKRTKKLIKNNIDNSDYVIARLPSVLGIMACKYCEKTNKPYLVEMVGCPYDSLWNYGTIKAKILAIPFALMNKIHIKKATSVIYVTNEFLQKRYPTRGKSIGCSDVVINDNTKSLEKRLKKIDNKKPKEKIILGTIGSLDMKCKGQQYVIRAISLLNKKGYQIEYQLIGAGNPNRVIDLAKKLRTEDSVTYIGTKPHEEIFKWLDDIDIYIQPSNQEGLCRSLIEAMSRACPCIASNAGGNHELVSKKYIFKKRKYKQLSDIIEMLADTKEQKKAASTCYKKSQRYKYETINARRNNYLEKELIGHER